MELKNKTVIITGASSGIGAATAKKLATAGANVVLAARRMEKLQDLKKEIDGNSSNVHCVETDVTNRDDVEQLFKETMETFGTCDILINNAGIMPLSYMKNLHVDEWHKMVDVNITGVLHSLEFALPGMTEQNSGHIVNISSVAGRTVMKGSAVYSATKFAIRALSDGLRQELSPDHHIRVTCIEPGAVDTELMNSITDKELMDDFKGSMGSVTFLESDDIATAIHYAVTQPDRVNVNELQVRPTDQG